MAAERNPVWKRKLAALSRWLHIYLSMVCFAMVFFFALTGLTLNHADWFGRQAVIEHKGAVNPAWAKDVAKLEIVEYLRAHDGVKGALSDFRVDDTQLAISFKGPGYAADAFLDRATGGYDLTETRMGAVAVWNDLHKGRDTGKAWSFLIDVSAALMALVSLTGLILIFFLKKRLVSGLIAAAAGATALYAVYAALVP
ncbi:MAG: PepSY-associated TM helix domain-containing protein [Bryobacteraceae bacterium]